MGGEDFEASDVVRTGLAKMGCRNVTWIVSAHDRVKQCALVLTAMNLRLKRPVCRLLNTYVYTHVSWISSVPPDCEDNLKEMK
jgi:hypothetical protein